jgi:phage antirepressor YoqD-like protein
MKPKAEYHDSLVAHGHSTNFRDTAKELHFPVKRFPEWLERDGFIYRDYHGSIRPIAAYTPRYFVEKDFFNKDTDYAGIQTLVTVEGKAFFMRRYADRRK